MLREMQVYNSNPLQRSSRSAIISPIKWRHDDNNYLKIDGVILLLVIFGNLVFEHR